jgi:dTDP-4-amino-4,6-dideoxygalactose transaminase
VTIPIFDAAAEFAAAAPDLEAAALRTLRSGRYILGEEVESFEREVADYLGTTHAVSCASGTDALTLALRALDIGSGDEVVTTAFTFFATVSAILACGATPVLCDIDPATFCIDPAEAARRHSTTVRAILPVHLYGRMAELDPLLALGAPVVEDAAQAFGAVSDGRQAGTIGTLGCHSFFPTKNLGGFGDGGLVVTGDADLAAKLRMMRAHGSREKYLHELVGTNSRLDTLQASMLRVRLRRVDDALAARRAIAAVYEEMLAELPVVTPGAATEPVHTHNIYVIRIPSGRDDVAARLAASGIQTAVHYATPIHLQPAMRPFGYAAGDFPEAERASREVLTLPMYPSLGPDGARAVANALREALR